MSGKKNSIMKSVRNILLALLGTMLAISLLNMAVLQVILALFLGWLAHTFRVIPLLDWNAELIFCFLLALTLATWMLHRALNWLHKQGTLKQAWTPKRTLALTSLLLMLFGMSVAMTGIVHQSIWVMKGPIAQSNHRSRTTNEINNVKQLYTACFSYAKDHKGNMPSNLRLLIDEGLLDEDHILLYQPQNRDLPPEPWVYYPWTLSDRTNLIVLHSSSPAFNGRWIVGQLNGAVQTVSNEEFQEMLATTQAALRRKRTAGHPHGPSPSHPRQRVVPPQ